MLEEKNNTKSNSTMMMMDEKRNRIQVSNTKRPLFFYLNLAKRYLKQHDEVELSALGMDGRTHLEEKIFFYYFDDYFQFQSTAAIPTVVIIAEILKRNEVATNQNVMISTVNSKDRNSGRFTRKARIEIVLGRMKNSDT
ncbi:hypothetical protein M9H77_35390 [Catharanthus roseus]|uniref:Uncharacterized protein n=1 Tax=Catharanthus roseus TaxID=4058 RepID=A0ACB9ZP55_CATRO|nr:hypothetical protein M9H77_35390 [Catharanthus roseus]